MGSWAAEAADLIPAAESEERFFVRVSEAGRQALQEVFPGSSPVTVPGREEDFGFFTGAMKEKEFLAGCGQLGPINRGRGFEQGTPCVEIRTKRWR